MEYPEPTIDIDSAARALIIGTHEPGERSGRDGSWLARDQLKALLAQAWEEGRWSDPNVTLNPYGEPAAALPELPAGTLRIAGLPLTKLRAAAQAALAWVENMSPTVRRTALAEQLRSALEGK